MVGIAVISTFHSSGLLISGHIPPEILKPEALAVYKMSCLETSGSARQLPVNNKHASQTRQIAEICHNVTSES